MDNRKNKIICVGSLILIIVIAFFVGIKWSQYSQTKMIESVQSYAKNAGLKDVSIELSKYKKGELFIRCSNFAQIKWDTLLSMHEDILNVRGVESAIYSKYTDSYGYTLYYIDIEENLIRHTGGAEDIDYYGSWGNGQKHFSISASEIKKDLEERGNESNDEVIGNETDAKICAVNVVKNSLKTPSTAEFCKYTEMTATNLGGSQWEITGYVDAQNSFGASLRQNWTVTLTLTESGYKDASVTFI